MMITEPIGVYVHVPYCVQKCNYCDFCSLPCGTGGVPHSYVLRLKEEILCYKADAKIPVSTVFFGGGTPSLLTPLQLETIVSALKEVFEFDNTLEFTLEVNPGTVDKEKLLAFHKIGVNRLSIGVQSLNENELVSLGRIHTANQALETVKTARALGFDNISCDVMYGIPHQTRASFLNTLYGVLSLGVTHISVYGLMLEEGTPFYKMQADLPLPSEDCECDMYYDAHGLLTSQGFNHYEISNYARPGFKSRHNLKYWQMGEYLGFGAAAASFYNGKRLLNTDKIDAYLNKKGLNYIQSETVSKDDFAFEYAMLALRLASGIDLADYKRRFKKEFKVGREELIGRYVSLGLIYEDKERIALTERGFYLSNTILCDLL